MDVYEVVARREAQRAGRAKVLVGRRRVPVHADALILCPVMLSGEQTTIHAVAVGQRTGPPRVLCVADPRNRTAQYALFADLADILERYFMDCVARAAYPQVWSTSPAVITLLDTIADRLWSARAGNGIPGSASAAVVANQVRARQLAQLLHYLTERTGRPGQVTLLATADVLRQHVVSGRDPAADAHLAALLTWVRPPASLALDAAIARAERLPMADRTDPEFDERRLEPLVTAYNRLPATATAARAQAEAVIRRALSPVVIAMYRHIQRALRVLERLRLPLLPAVVDLERLEAEAFRAFWQRYSGPTGARWSRRRSPIHEARELEIREALAEFYAYALLTGDPLERAKQRATGALIRAELRAYVPTAARGGTSTTTPGITSGTSTSPSPVPPAPFRTRLLSIQAQLRVRPGDTLAWLDGDVVIQVTSLRERTGVPRGLVIDGVVTSGQTLLAILPRGTVLDLGPKPVQLPRVRAVQGRFSRLTRTPPWTHGILPTPPAGVSTAGSTAPVGPAALGLPAGGAAGNAALVPSAALPAAPRPVDALQQVEALS